MPHVALRRVTGENGDWRGNRKGDKEEVGEEEIKGTDTQG